MDYEKEYKAMVQRAKELHKDGNALTKQQMEIVCPELAESEDEKRIGNVIYCIVRDNKEVKRILEGNGVSVDNALAYLEKQKEQKPVDNSHIDWSYIGKYQNIPKEDEYESIENGDATGLRRKEQKPIEPSDDELQRHQDELYDFKVFAAKQAKEYHISFVHDFEWHNFCAELLSYFNEKHTTDGKAMLHVAEKSYQIGLRDGRMEQKPAEWSEEDERNFHWISVAIQERHLTPEYTKEVHRILSWLKSLRPQSKQEWNEEDEQQIRQIEQIIKNWASPKLQEEIHNFLSSLRPQPHWKPSKQEMDAFETALKGEFQNGVYPATTLCKLFGELKKLYYNDEIPEWKPSEEQMNAIYEAAQRLPIDRENGNCLYNLYDELQKLM